MKPTVYENFVANQYDRLKNDKFNLCFLINMFHRGYIDYCMETWINVQVLKKR